MRDASSGHDADLVRRALAAWFRSGMMEQPTRFSVGEFKGRRYVVLRTDAWILGVYRVRNDGMLKRLRRWPPEAEMEL
jgi:hypothetical protein